MARDSDVAGHRFEKVSEMEPDSKGPKASTDRRRPHAESSDPRAVDALQARLFAQALVDLGLTKYSALASERRQRT